MQTRTHVPGQVLNEVSRGTPQNGNVPNGTGLPWPRWQSEEDIGLRRHIMDNILQLFTKRKPHVTLEWQQKLPGFVRRVEEDLYQSAACKDEYADLETLEQRLQSLAGRMLQEQSAQSVSSSAPMSNMIPTPGVASNMIQTPSSGSNMMQTSGSVASMMPTPGTTGNLLQSGSGVPGGLPIEGLGGRFASFRI